jgi:hypothetical protein
MKNNPRIKFKIGKSPGLIIYIIPTLYYRISKDQFDENHSLSIEFQWICYGCGVKFYWKNKKVLSSDNLKF